MPQHVLPILIESEELKPLLGDPRICLVDLGRSSTYEQLHIAGALFLDYAAIVAARPPTGGLLPEAGLFSQALARLGVSGDTHVVAYDDEGGGKAARLLWTLEVAGHRAYSLLNGGLHAWANEGHPITRDTTPPPAPSGYRVALPADAPVIADTDFIRSHLHDPGVALLDARSPAEYSGYQRYAQRGGHIPGAVNLEWTEAMDRKRNLRLKPADELNAVLQELGIRRDQTVVAYCQTHHRSAHTWFMLKWLGYAARGYPGSWSEWGNRDDVPVEE